MHLSRTLSVLCGLAAVVASPDAGALAQALPRVVIQTELGEIEVEIDTVRAPITAANFLRYVDLPRRAIPPHGAGGQSAGQEGEDRGGAGRSRLAPGP